MMFPMHQALMMIEFTHVVGFIQGISIVNHTFGTSKQLLTYLSQLFLNLVVTWLSSKV